MPRTWSAWNYLLLWFALSLLFVTIKTVSAFAETPIATRRAVIFRSGTGSTTPIKICMATQTEKNFGDKITHDSPTRKKILSSALKSMSTRAPKENSDRILLVGNLDWLEPKASILDKLCLALETSETVAVEQKMSKNDSVTLELKDLPSPLPARDRGKFHGGSARVTFPTVGAAEEGRTKLLRYIERNSSVTWKIRWAPPFDTFVHRQIPQPVKKAPLTDEQRRRRIERAASYARQRARVAERTDSLLERVRLWNRKPQDSSTQARFASRTNVVEELSTTRIRTENAVEVPPTLVESQLNWSNDVCPEAVDPCRGGGLPPDSARGIRKRAAAEAFLHVLNHALLPTPDSTVPKGSDGSGEKRSVVDLGCGAGNLTLALAWWLRSTGYTVLGVDRNQHSLDRLAKRAMSVNLESAVNTLYQDLEELQQLDESVDAVVSLHACGAASDWSIQIAVSNHVPFAISPCCVGKVKKMWQPGRMPQIAAKCSSIVYPRSKWLRKLIDLEEYELLASAADYGVVYTYDVPNDDELARRRRCKLAKRIVELDRLEWAREHGYEVRMVELPGIGPLYPKRELLLGALAGSEQAAKIAVLATV